MVRTERSLLGWLIAIVLVSVIVLATAANAATLETVNDSTVSIAAAELFGDVLVTAGAANSGDGIILQGYDIHNLERLWSRHFPPNTRMYRSSCDDGASIVAYEVIGEATGNATIIEPDGPELFSLENLRGGGPYSTQRSEFFYTTSSLEGSGSFKLYDRLGNELYVQPTLRKGLSVYELSDTVLFYGMFEKAYLINLPDVNVIRIFGQPVAPHAYGPLEPTVKSTPTADGLLIWWRESVFYVDQTAYDWTIFVQNFMEDSWQPVTGEFLNDGRHVLLVDSRATRTGDSLQTRFSLYSVSDNKPIWEGIVDDFVYPVSSRGRFLTQVGNSICFRFKKSMSDSRYEGRRGLFTTYRFKLNESTSTLERLDEVKGMEWLYYDFTGAKRISILNSQANRIIVRDF